MNSVSPLNARETPGGGRSKDPVFLESQDASSWLDHQIGRDSPVSKPLNQPKHPKPNWWGRGVFLFLLLFFLLVVGVGAGLFLARYQLLAVAEKKALKALADNDIHLSYDSAAWEFPRGVVFTNVRLYETAGRQSLLLEASNLGLNQDLYSLAKERSLDAINATASFRDATLTLYHQGDEVAAFEHLDSYIAATARQISIEKFEGVFSGLAIEATGRAVLLDESAASTSAESEGGMVSEEAVPAQSLGERLDFSPVGALKEWLVFGSEDQPPKLEIDFEVPAGPDRKINATGRFWGRSFSWKELPVDSASVDFSFTGADRVVDLPSVNLVFRGEPVDGRMKLWPDEKRLEIGSLRSRADFVEIVSTINPTAAEGLSMVKFTDAPEVGLQGTLDLADPGKSDLVVEYSHWEGLTLNLDGRPLTMKRIRTKLNYSEGVVFTDNFEGMVLDGAVRGSMAVRPDKENFGFEADVKLADLPLQSLARFAGSDQSMGGLLNGEFKGAGAVDLAKLNGSGELRIEGEELVTIPVMGEIQDFMGTVAPVFGNPGQSTLNASYTITDGVCKTEDLEMKSDGIKVKATGTYGLHDRQVMATAHGFLDGLLGAPTELLGKALEVHVEGPVDDLTTSFDNKPAEFSSEAAKAAFAAAGASMKAAKALAGDPLQGVGDVANGLGGTTGDLIEKARERLIKLGKSKEASAAVEPKTPEVAKKPSPGTGISFVPKSQGLKDVLKAQAEKAMKASKEVATTPSPPIPMVEGGAAATPKETPPVLPAVGPPLPPEVPKEKPAVVNSVDSDKKAEPAPKPEPKPETVAKPAPKPEEPKKKVIRAIPFVPREG